MRNATNQQWVEVSSRNLACMAPLKCTDTICGRYCSFLCYLKFYVTFSFSRIIDQLMYRIPSDVQRHKSIFLVGGLSKWNVSAGQIEFHRNKCPVYQCILTEKHARKADAVLFTKFTDSDISRPPNQVPTVHLCKINFKEMSYVK